MTPTMNFDHESLGQRVLFGTHMAAQNLVTATSRWHSPLVIAARHDSHLVDPILGALAAAPRFDDVRPHVPVEQAEAARRTAHEIGADVLVCIGGGSTTGLAKAIALTSGLPIVAVPTTYAGSEATDVWGLTSSQHKQTGKDARVLPTTVIYDAALTLSMPAALSISSAFNALAHCIDSLWAPKADPINAALATEAIRALSQALPILFDDPGELIGREQALYGAYLGAAAFASAGSGLHHKICHVLGGRFDLPHAQTHTAVLPHVLAFNAPYTGAAERIADALNASSAVGGFNALHRSVRAASALRNYGLCEQDLDEAVELILPVVPERNPRPVTPENLRALLHAALVGDQAASLTF
ncbi:maleylacetate reductase [Rhodococcus erythropolis]|uniref:maleylacetate reductase n=1 Tax=Rhodococcus erythropolis TaxID=1833 RepID=UPI00210BBC77|nr:maleylacetate reductase [Rhodococcus erythropolis]MCQ4128224.1 maleylacetate reductase [Rhodococcus erythropolis]